jgi:hypothetical protein
MKFYMLIQFFVLFQGGYGAGYGYPGKGYGVYGDGYGYGSYGPFDGFGYGYGKKY